MCHQMAMMCLSVSSCKLQINSFPLCESLSEACGGKLLLPKSLEWHQKAVRDMSVHLYLTVTEKILYFDKVAPVVILCSHSVNWNIFAIFNELF